MTNSNDAEYSDLARQVEKIEKLIVDAGGEVSYLLKAFVKNAKGRLEDIKFAEYREEIARNDEKAKETAAVIALVEKEKNLTAGEKHQYGEFLKEDFFTRGNFQELERFYADGGAWSRLSAGGKEQMSQRVWEGIRRDEYSFEELPENVRKKEAHFLYQQMTGKVAAAPGIENVPDRDRGEFIQAYETNDAVSTIEILSRPTISQNIYSGNPTSLREVGSSQTIAEPEKPAASEKEEAVGAVTSTPLAFDENSAAQVPLILPRSGGPVRGR